jgi:hypothetical protein
MAALALNITLQAGAAPHLSDDEAEGTEPGGGGGGVRASEADAATGGWAANST